MVKLSRVHSGYSSLQDSFLYFHGSYVAFLSVLRSGKMCIMNVVIARNIKVQHMHAKAKYEIISNEKDIKTLLN